MLPKADEVRLHHMLDAANTVIDMTRNRQRHELDQDIVFALALVKAIEIIGEAAGQVSSETQQRFPEIEWKGVIAMRHRLVHGYFDVDYEIVWRTALGPVPALAQSLRIILR